MIGQPLTADTLLIEAGLGSLTLLKLLAMLRKRYPTAGQISQTIAFEHPTLRAIDAHLTAATGGDDLESSLPPLEPLAGG
eukprot:scaffold56944_cov70-Phaeocystis_antarctica.AAC.1